MIDFIADKPLRRALLVSVVLHVLLVGWVAGMTRPVRTEDIESLRIVPVNTVRMPAPKEPSIPAFRPPRPVMIRRSRRPTVRRPTPAVVRKSPPARLARPPRHRSDAVRRISSAGGSRRTAPVGSSSHRALSPSDTGARSTRGEATVPIATRPPASSAPEDGAGAEDVPEGPVDLDPVGNEDTAVQTTPLTKGAMVKSNTTKKDEINTALIRQTVFSGPGTLYTTSFNVPASAPPGTVYRLEIVDAVLSDANGNAVPFTPVNGTLTILPTKAPLPPVDQPSLSGAVLGVGNLYAHRGTAVTVEIFAGDDVKDVMGVQAKVKVGAVKVAPRRIIREGR